MTRTLRVKTAVFLAVLYTCTVLAPHAAVALSGPQGLLHCFTQTQGASAHDHGTAPAAHVHADGSAHKHANEGGTAGDEQNGPAAACCGLFTASAIANEAGILLPTQLHSTLVHEYAPDGLRGLNPVRLIRPPIA